MPPKKGTNIKLSDRRSILNVSIKHFISDYIFRVDLDADYQREKIWTNKQQELLLDSIITDIDIPKIYLVEIRDNKQFSYECLDGKQRLSALLRYFSPDAGDESPLLLKVFQEGYTYQRLKREHPNLAKKIENYVLSFTIYSSMDEVLVREIFRRLQLGIRLNSGELLRTRTGTIRDFVFKEIGNTGYFFRNSNLSEKRFSRPFTLAQICLNSFTRIEADGDFARARLQDIELFFEQKHDLSKNDKNLGRIKNVLKVMDREFGVKAINISSRAVAVSAYLFVEELFTSNEESLIPLFVEYFLKLLSEIKDNSDLLSRFEKPKNPVILEEFQKYILQASVESYSIRRRHEFLRKSFDYYLSQKARRKIIGLPDL